MNRVKFNVKLLVDKMLYLLFLPRLTLTKQFEETLLLFFAELQEPAAPKVQHQKPETFLVLSTSPVCSRRGGRCRR